MPAPAHIFTVRVYYEDTDFSGAVYHANYLRFLERGRSEMLRTFGIHHRALFEEHAAHHATAFVVRAMAIEFMVPARMDDVLQVESRTVETRGASARMGQRILRDGQVLLTAQVRIAAVSAGHAVRFPRDVRAAFERSMQDQTSPLPASDP